MTFADLCSVLLMLSLNLGVFLTVGVLSIIGHQLVKIAKHLDTHNSFYKTDTEAQSTPDQQPDNKTEFCEGCGFYQLVHCPGCKSRFCLDCALDAKIADKGHCGCMSSESPTPKDLAAPLICGCGTPITDRNPDFYWCSECETWRCGSCVCGCKEEHGDG